MRDLVGRKLESTSALSRGVRSATACVHDEHIGPRAREWGYIETFHRYVTVAPIRGNNASYKYVLGDIHGLCLTLSCQRLYNLIPLDPFARTRD